MDHGHWLSRLLLLLEHLLPLLVPLVVHGLHVRVLRSLGPRVGDLVQPGGEGLVASLLPGLVVRDPCGCASEVRRLSSPPISWNQRESVAPCLPPFGFGRRSCSWVDCIPSYPGCQVPYPCRSGRPNYKTRAGGPSLRYNARRTLRSGQRPLPPAATAQPRRTKGE